jgi:hypothetical protein
MTVSIPEIPLRPDPQSEEARAAVGFRWAGGNVGRRHKIGGKPNWLQPTEAPTCEECGKEMTFYAQLDSIGDEYVIADCGVVFVFVCFGCFGSKSIVQSA